jgi:hypothetical protein
VGSNVTLLECKRFVSLFSSLDGVANKMVFSVFFRGVKILGSGYGLTANTGEDETISISPSSLTTLSTKSGF